MFKPSTSYKQQEDQLAQILQQTFENTAYRDQQIDHLLLDDHPITNNNNNRNANGSNINGNYQQYAKNKSIIGYNYGRRRSSLSNSDIQSDISDGYIPYKDQFINLSNKTSLSDEKYSGQQPMNQLEQSQLQQLQQQQQKQQQNKYIQQFNNIITKLQQSKHHYTLEQIKDKYEKFMVSEPAYQVDPTQSVQENTFVYNTLKNVNITTMHVGNCAILSNYRIVMGTDDGRIAIFQKNYSKPVNIFQAFANDRRIVNVKWSKNMEYLAVSTNKKQMKIYSFKQSINIEDKVILRMRKQPTQIISITTKSKQLPHSILSIQFIHQNPLQLLLLDQADQIWLLQYKKHIISYRPFLSQLPLKFNNIFQLKCHNIKYKSSQSNNYNKQCTIMAVSSEYYVTICLLKPYFQVILAYDKQKRAKAINKDGYAHIHFREKPVGILIVWGKYANLLNFDVKEYIQFNQEREEKIQVKISNQGGLLLPEVTILGGLLTDTLMYQLSQSGIKIYSCCDFTKNQQELTTFRQPIYHHNFSLFSLPSSLSLMQQLADMNTPPLQVLHQLHTFLQPCYNQQLFVTSSTSLLSIKIKNFQEYIHNLIENLNNWKVGLQMLVDCYHGKYRNFDNMTLQAIVRNIREYIGKYVDFLKVVIGIDEEQREDKVINKQNKGNKKMEMNRKQIWDQQTNFILNIVIEAQLFEYLGDYLLPKLHQIGPFLTPNNSSNKSKNSLCCNITPFIYMNKLKKLTYNGISILLQCLQKQQLSYLLLNISPQQNQIDFPHTINQLLLNNQLYLQLIVLNVIFNDYYTPFVVLVSKCEIVGNSQRENYENEENHEIEVGYQFSQELISGCLEELEEERGGELEELWELICWASLTLLKSLNNPHCQYSFFKYNNNTLKKKQPINLLQTFLNLLQSSIIPLLLSTPYQTILFKQILPQLYSHKCLQLLNDISNNRLRTLTNNQPHDLMSQILININLNKIADEKLYWLCILNLFSKYVIKCDMFMGIRYLTKQQVSPQLLQRYCSQVKKQLYGQFIKISTEILAEYFQQLLHSQYITLITILGKILSEHIKVLHEIISNNKFRSQLLYDYIFDNYDSIEEQKETLQTMYQIIYEKLEMFIGISNGKLVMLLIRKYYGFLENVSNNNVSNGNNGNNNRSYDQGSSNKKKWQLKLLDFIQKKDIDNSYRLQFIQKLLRQFQIRMENEDIRYNHKATAWQLFVKIRLIYIQLLAINGRGTQIFAEIREEDYPIDETLTICRKYGINDAEAYLLVKSGGQGDITTAIQLYFKLASDKFVALKYSKEIREGFNTAFNNFQTYFYSIAKECIKICGESTQEWFLIADKLKQFKYGYYQQFQAYLCDLIGDLITYQIYPELSTQIVRKVSFPALLKHFQWQNNVAQMDLSLLRILIAQILKNNTYRKQMYLLTRQSYIEFEQNFVTQIIRETRQGFSTTGICEVCNSNDGNLLIHYNRCNHNIHPSCSQDVKLCYLCGKQTWKMLQKSLDNIAKVKVQLYAGRQHEDQLMNDENDSGDKKMLRILSQDRKRNVMGKLKQFDEQRRQIVYDIMQ